MRTRHLLAFLAILPLAAQEPQPPKPTPHHEAMKALEGTWDATFKVFGEPGKPPMEGKGVEVNTRILGGFWLQSEVTADMGGMPFQGRGLFGYDTMAKKHVGTWVDSTGSWPANSRGTCKDHCREVTVTFDGWGMDGKPVTFKEVCIQKDDDHRTMAMYVKGRDGKFVCNMEMAYTRRKVGPRD